MDFGEGAIIVMNDINFFYMTISAYLTKPAMMQTSSLYSEENCISEVTIAKCYEDRPNVVAKAYQRLYQEIELKGHNPSQITLIIR